MPREETIITFIMVYIMRILAAILDYAKKYYRVRVLTSEDLLPNNLLSMIRREKPNPQMIILAHSMGRAKQIAEHLHEHYYSSHGLIIALTTHDRELGWPKIQNIQAHVIVGTPGITLDYAKKYKCFELCLIKILIIDKVHKLIRKQGYRDQTIRLARGLPPACQVVINSNANVSNQEHVDDFADTLRRCINRQSLQPRRVSN